MLLFYSSLLALLLVCSGSHMFAVHSCDDAINLILKFMDSSFSSQINVFVWCSLRGDWLAFSVIFHK